MVKHYSPCDGPECSHKPEGKHHESKIVFSCGKGIGANLPVPVCNQAAVWHPDLLVATVTLDTGELKKADVKIDFSSVVAFKTTGFPFAIAITFELSRVCNNGPKVPLTTFTYAREAGLILREAQPLQQIEGVVVEFKDPIAFTWCDCHDCCPGCCTYLVEIVDVTAIDINYAIVGNVGINALAVSGK
ncbi:MAG: DUF4489 domain-containing protein [Syntrophomonadaceae bacterium]|nr:DUF4489 domain-containing protein [Syntrophomonadaceae bacterium]